MVRFGGVRSPSNIVVHRVFPLMKTLLMASDYEWWKHKVCTIIFALSFWFYWLCYYWGIRIPINAFIISTVINLIPRKSYRTNRSKIITICLSYYICMRFSETKTLLVPCTNKIFHFCLYSLPLAKYLIDNSMAQSEE